MYINITETKEDGTVCNQYDIANSEDVWIRFRDRYLS
jgi:hypothetical protein